MYNKNDLINDLKMLEINPNGTLLVHSSYKSIGDVDGGADTVLDALSQYMADGLLILPTHSWDNINADNPVFDVRNEPACVGFLPNLFMKRENVIRSLHPTHSVAALGKDAAEYTVGEEKDTSPCPRTGCWGKLYDRNAQILFIGCNLTKNTFIHGVEEWNKIPNRISEGIENLSVIDFDGKKHDIQMHRHHCEYTSPSENYDKLEAPFIKYGAISYGKFGDAHCILGDAVNMADITTAILKKAPDIFGNHEKIPEEIYKNLKY